MDDGKYAEEMEDLYHKIDAVVSILYAARRADRSRTSETQGCISNAIDDLSDLGRVVLARSGSVKKSLREASASTEVYAYTKFGRILLEGKDVRTAIRNAIGKVEGGGAVIIGKNDKATVLVPYAKI